MHHQLLPRVSHPHTKTSTTLKTALKRFDQPVNVLTKYSFKFMNHVQRRNLGKHCQRSECESEQINSNTYKVYSSAAKHKEGETGLCIKKREGEKKRNSAFFQFLFQSYESLSESMTHNSTVFPLVTLGKGGPLHFLISRKTGETKTNKQLLIRILRGIGCREQSTISCFDIRLMSSFARFWLGPL